VTLALDSYRFGFHDAATLGATRVGAGVARFDALHHADAIAACPASHTGRFLKARLRAQQRKGA
jgi:hypothetical protein